MDGFRYEHNLSNFIRMNFIFIFWGVAITAGLIFVGVQVHLSKKHERTIIVPDHLARNVAYTDDEIPLEALNDYVEKIADYGFNFTPATARNRLGKLLTFFHPDAFPSAKQTYYELADNVERMKVTQSFIIDKPIEVDTDKKTITFSGIQRMMIETKPLAADTKTYVITYIVTSGLWQIMSLDEKIQGAVVPGGSKNAK